MTQFYCIVPPVSPWDEKFREAIEMDLARRTIGASSAEAWRILIGAGIDHREFSRHVQHWYDLGYRVRKITLALMPEGS